MPSVMALHGFCRAEEGSGRSGMRLSGSRRSTTEPGSRRWKRTRRGKRICGSWAAPDDNVRPCYQRRRSMTSDKVLHRRCTRKDKGREAGESRRLWFRRPERCGKHCPVRGPSAPRTLREGEPRMLRRRKGRQGAEGGGQPAFLIGRRPRRGRERGGRPAFDAEQGPTKESMKMNFFFI